MSCTDLIVSLARCFSEVGLDFKSFVSQLIFNPAVASGFNSSVTDTLIACSCSSIVLNQVSFFDKNNCASQLGFPSITTTLLMSACQSSLTLTSSSLEKFLVPNEAAKSYLLKPNPTKTRKIKLAVELPYAHLNDISIIPFGSNAEQVLAQDVAIEVIL
jgi:hypothetical protein